MKPRIAIALGALLLLAASASALRNPALVQQGELPRDQYLDLVQADKVELDRICVKFSEDTRVRLRDGRFASLEGRDLSTLEAFLAKHPGVRPERLFQSWEEKALDERIAEAERLSGYDNADLNNWYLLRVPQPNREAKALLEELLAIDLVQTCYYEPIASPATCGTDPAPATPLWVANQDYREPAPTGVDIDYAWAHSPTYGNGVSGYYWEDIEGGWCETHEDYPSNFIIRNPPDSLDPVWFNHGTAVVSIIGACDDGKGVTGLTPDCRPNARNVFNHASTADAIAAVGIDLIEGETYLIELHAAGPSQGTTCACNCSQFEFIAMEYWTANFDAILLNATSADQLICVEAAGNGSMNLDWAGYGGAFNPGVRDSQAILVGAGSSGASHDPMCFTNHGTRISAYGWGENVYSAGYGTLFNQTGCEQDYDYGFSGTSSATPIVAGAAISLANIHFELEGTHAAPTTIRARLITNGTPQASEFTHEINLMPNLRGVLAPDLAPFTISGFDAEAVVNGTLGDHTVPATLPSAPAASYFAWGWINWSHYSEATVSPSSTLFLDDAAQWTAGSTLGRFSATYVNGVAATVPGGRHVVREELDANALLVEGNESNNRFAPSYCWDGVLLASGAPQTRDRAPNRYPVGSVYPSCDGYRNGGDLSGWWEVYGVMPATSADYDLWLYDTAPTSTAGWDYGYAVTSASVSSTDFVVANQNQASVLNPLWVGVHNYSNSGEDYTVEGQGSVYQGIPPATQTLLASGDLGSGEILDVWEFNGLVGQQVWFRLDTDGEAPLRLALYGPATTYDSFGGYDWQMTADAATPEAIGTYTVTAAGYHGLVLVKRDRGNLAADVDYSLYWGLAASPDLVVGPHGSYDAPLVARNAGGCGVLPAQLNETTSYVDVGVNNLGAGYAAPGWDTRFLLEGRTISQATDFPNWLAPGGTAAWCGGGLGVVKGGRHEVGARHDIGGELPESNEANNHAYTQYCWVPYPLAPQTPVTRDPAASWRDFDNPGYALLPDFNQDGYSLQLHFWSAVACVPLGTADQVNLQGFDYHSTGIDDGLLGEASFSFTGAGLTCVNAMNGNMTGGVVRDFGAHQNLGWPSHAPTDDYVIEGSVSQSDLLVDQLYGPFSIPAGSLVRSYDLNVLSSGPVPVQLLNDGPSDLGLLVFPPGAVYCDYSDALAIADAGGPGADEGATVNFTGTGWAGIVVYKHGHADVPLSGDYRLRIGTPPSSAPAAISDLRITPVDFEPGSATVEIDFTPVTEDVGGNPLVVDHYRLYTVQFDGYDFSAPWIEDLFAGEYNDGNGLLYFGNIGWTTSAYLYLTAVDENGAVVAASPGLPVAWQGLEPTTDAPRVACPPLPPAPHPAAKTR